MKHTTLSKSKLRELKLRKKKRAIIASRNINDYVNNMPKDKPTFAIKVLKKVVFGKNDTHYVQESKSWKQKKQKQPYRLRHSFKGWKWISKFTKEKGWITEHVLVKYKSDYFHEDPVKMTQQAYWEKIVRHKLAKWERKNPQPCSDDDMFTEKLVEWKDKREKAVERFRDVVVSVYDKLKIVAVDDKKEVLLATIKDDADRMKVLKTASKVQDAFHKKHPKVLNYKLYDHKPKKVLMETHKLAA